MARKRRMDKLLHTYWIVFKNPPVGMRLGCGVTAYNYDDAVLLLNKTLFDKAQLPQIEQVTEDIKVTDLEQNHVIPNMGVINLRGVWFPKI